MSKKETTREEARQILKNGILDMSVERLIQMSELGLIGNIALSNEVTFINNLFNHINYDEESNVITFSVGEAQGNYGAISFSVGAITDISGCENAENPDEWLNINIKLKNDTDVLIKVLY